MRQARHVAEAEGGSAIDSERHDEEGPGGDPRKAGDADLGEGGGEEKSGNNRESEA